MATKLLLVGAIVSALLWFGESAAARPETIDLGPAPSGEPNVLIGQESEPVVTAPSLDWHGLLVSPEPAVASWDLRLTQRSLSRPIIGSGAWCLVVVGLNAGEDLQETTSRWLACTAVVWSLGGN